MYVRVTQVMAQFIDALERAHDAIITSLQRQSEVATSFWRCSDVFIASCVCLEYMSGVNEPHFINASKDAYFPY